MEFCNELKRCQNSTKTKPITIKKAADLAFRAKRENIAHLKVPVKRVHTFPLLCEMKKLLFLTVKQTGSLTRLHVRITLKNTTTYVTFSIHSCSRNHRTPVVRMVNKLPNDLMPSFFKLSSNLSPLFVLPGRWTDSFPFATSLSPDENNEESWRFSEL